MLNFLQKFGNEPLTELTDADRLVFAQMVYLDFDPSSQNLPLREALDRVRFDEDSPTAQRFSFQQKDDRRLCELAQCPRYASVQFVAFAESYDPEREKQFAAMALDLPGGMRLLCFRGTDNTLAGWKEDFNLACLSEIPSQAMARDFVHLYGKDAAKIELLGHSKGGNLALYAAVTSDAEIQAKVSRAVSLDGPGLNKSLTDSQAYRSIQRRLRLIVPQSSLVGLLFHQPENMRIVESRLVSVFQHYPYLWKIEDDHFCDAQSLSPTAQKLAQSVQGMIDRLPQHAREQFVEAVYEILGETGAETFTDLVGAWASSAKSVVKKLAATDRETYILLLRVLGTFLLCAAEALGVKIDIDLWDEHQ